MEKPLVRLIILMRGGDFIPLVLPIGRAHMFTQLIEAKLKEGYLGAVFLADGDFKTVFFFLRDFSGYYITPYEPSPQEKVSKSLDEFLKEHRKGEEWKDGT